MECIRSQRQHTTSTMNTQFIVVAILYVLFAAYLIAVNKKEK